MVVADRGIYVCCLCVQLGSSPNDNNKDNDDANSSSNSNYNQPTTNQPTNKRPNKQTRATVTFYNNSNKQSW